jgi:cytochrome P450
MADQRVRATGSGMDGQLLSPPHPRLPAELTLNAMFLLNSPRTLAVAYRRYGPVTRLKLGPFDTVLLVGPEANRLLFASGADSVQAGPIWRRILPFYDGALLTTDGERHQRQRRAFRAISDPDCVGSYVPVMLDSIREHTATWSKRVSLYRAMEYIALSNATRALMGFRLAPERYSSFFQWHREIAGMILGVPGLEFPGTRRWRGLRAQRAMWHLTREIVAARRDRLGADALSAAISSSEQEDGTQHGDEVLVHAFSILAAGHATMAAFMTFALAEVLARPDLMARLLREQEEVIRNDPPSAGTIRRLSFTFDLLREVERLYPPLPCVARTAMRDLEIEDFRISAGSTLLGSLWLTHQIPGLFPRPQSFDPDRFRPPRQEHLRRYALAGFGGGPHLCLGMNFAKIQAALVLHAVVRHFRLTLLRPEEPEVRFRPFAVPARPIMVDIERVRPWRW